MHQHVRSEAVRISCMNRASGPLPASLQERNSRACQLSGRYLMALLMVYLEICL